MLFAPFKEFGQSAIHFFPDKINGVFPIMYYIAPVIILVLIALIFILKRYRKDLLFGFLFYLITISVVSQVIPFGKSIIYERYTYIPYIGLFFIIAFIYNQLSNKWKYRRIAKPIFILLLVLMGILFSVKTWNRNRVWKNSITLFGNVARKYPGEAEGYFNKGLARYKINDVRGAVIDYNYAININRQYTEAYFWRGIGRFDLALPEPAIGDFNIVIQLDPKNSKAYYQRGNIKSFLGKKEEACADWQKADSLGYDIDLSVYKEYCE